LLRATGALVIFHLTLVLWGLMLGYLWIVFEMWNGYIVIDYCFFFAVHRICTSDGWEEWT